MTSGDESGRRERFLEGLRAGALSFGVVAQSAGLSPLAAIAMSAIVFAGSAQFTAISILAGGGTVGAAVLAAVLVNSRFLPMGAAIGPSLPGGPLRRALQGQTVVDASWGMAGRGDGTFDRWVLFGSTAPQYVGWLGGTIVGALGGNVIGDPEALGLDAVYPAFFLTLLLGELTDRRARIVAVLVASLAALLGLRGASARAAAARRQDEPEEAAA